MQLERFATAEGVAIRAADLVVETVRAKPTAVLLLPAGATPVLLFAELRRRVQTGALDLTRTRLFQLDELVGVAPTDPRSFHAFFEQHLVTPLGLAHAFQGLDGAARDPERVIEAHRSALVAAGPADLALLGLGLNGHVAFNEPGSSLESRARVTSLGATTLASLTPAFPSARPSLGMTLGLEEIAASRRVVLLVTGSAKAQRLGQVLAGGATRECPASLLQAHTGFLVLADLAAAPSPAPSRA